MSSHVMAAINANTERVRQLIDSALPDKSCQISCINGPESTVVSMPILSLGYLRAAFMV